MKTKKYKRPSKVVRTKEWSRLTKQGMDHLREEYKDDDPFILEKMPLQIHTDMLRKEIRVLSSEVGRGLSIRAYLQLKAKRVIHHCVMIISSALVIIDITEKILGQMEGDDEVGN